MRTPTVVQLRRESPGERVWLNVAGPMDGENEQETERLSVDLLKEADVFLKTYAKYRNALADVQGRRLKRRWSRKLMAESFIEAQVSALKAQMTEMFEAIGAFPAEDDDDAMKTYAKRVLAWDKKNNQTK
jgi:hypothetical protein